MSVPGAPAADTERPRACVASSGSEAGWNLASGEVMCTCLTERRNSGIPEEPSLWVEFSTTK